MATRGPLSDAAERLRRPGGRPRTRPRPDALANPLPPALLDVSRLADYLSVKPDTARDLIARGVIPRVRLPGATKDLRRVLVAKTDVDQVLAQWRDAAPLNP